MIRSFFGRRSLLAALVGLLLYATPTLAQTGSIAGVLVDSETGDPLIGANAIIEGTSTGTATDIDGHYTIPNLEPGTYTVLFSYIGYNPKTVQGVEVNAGETTRIELSLSPEAVEVGEVVVEAAALRNTDAALLRERAKASAVSDAISAEAISRSGSSDAADAMEKVTGASVVAGKYVYVRGLGDRYSSTQLNGVDLPSSDPDRKAVQFDLFPANLLDNIVTLKTFTPDRPGNFSGGLVDIGTKSFPDQFSFKVTASTSLNTNTNFGESYLTYAGGGVDWLASTNGNSLPTVLANPVPGKTIPSDRLSSRARFDPDVAETVNLYSKGVFDNVMAPIESTAPVNQSYSLSLGNKSKVFGNALGYVFSLTHSRSASSYNDGFVGRYSFAGTALASDLLLNDSRGSEETSVGGLANVTYRFSPNNEVGFNTLYTQTAESSARYQRGLWPKEFGANAENDFFVTRALNSTERALLSLQLRGKHYLPNLLGATIEWTGARAVTSQDQPDIRFFANTERVFGDETIYTASASGFRNPTRLFRDLEEIAYNGKLDITLPFTSWGNRAGKFKVGAAYERTDRDFNERFFVFNLADPTVILFTGDPAAYFADENMGIIDVDTLGGNTVRYTYGHYVTDESKPQNMYTGEREVAAGYAMVEMPLTRRLRLIGGARLESTLQEVTSEAYEIVDGDSTRLGGKIDEMDILPSLNLVYALRDNMNLRLAATRTLARPTFREFAPFASFDFIGDALVNGNPRLERTLISNYDLRWEWFVQPGELLAVSLFYKDLENPIERAIVGGTNRQIQFQNVPEARVCGAEFEMRTGLNRLASFLNYFSVGTNVTITRSRIDIPQSELETRLKADPSASDKRDLQGQSPYLVNVDLTYENYQSGTSAGFFYNVFGSRLSAVSLGGEPDVFERPRPQLDFTFSQQVFSDWQIKFSAKNLLNSSYKETYRFQGEDFTYYEYSLGRSFSLGVSYSPF